MANRINGIAKRVNVLWHWALLLMAFALTGCASHTGYSVQQQQDIDAHNLLIEDAQRFVHAHLFSSMLQVWSVEKRAWQSLITTQNCGAPDTQKALISAYDESLPLFLQAMRTQAQQQNALSSAAQQAALEDVAASAYQLFSRSYATGYGRQVSLADNMSPGLKEELCGGRIIALEDLLGDFSYPYQWASVTSPHIESANGLMAHVQQGQNAFYSLLKQHQAQFDALVYSHAYQRADAYQALFFEVNKFQNVERYGEMVVSLTQDDHGVQKARHNEFAYLVLSTGYHWGMLSVLALLEEEYPRLHDRKKQQAGAAIESVTSALSAEQSES